MVKNQRLFAGTVHLFFVVVCLLMIIPFLLIISISLSNEGSLIQHGYKLIPEQLDLSAYRFIFKVPQIILRAYGVTAIVTAAGTVTSLLLSSLTAYVISRRDYAYRSITTFYIFFTMLFSGGLVPYYILMTQTLGLKNTIGALILPGLLNVWNIMLLKAFLGKIPVEIIESAKMDGAREWGIFFRIVIPLSLPALATIGLIISFAYWNEWFNALLFIDNQNMVPLQLLLIRMLNSMEVLKLNLFQLGIPNLDLNSLPTMSARMSMVIIAAGPMLFIFPFFQRYFVQGLTVGSLKG